MSDVRTRILVAIGEDGRRATVALMQATMMCVRA